MLSVSSFICQINSWVRIKMIIIVALKNGYAATISVVAIGTSCSCIPVRTTRAQPVFHAYTLSPTHTEYMHSHGLTGGVLDK